MSLRFIALPTPTVRALQRGGPDADGNRPERLTSDGDGVPCRHCLQPVKKGEAYLVVAYRPFQSVQPYAETGPIFLHERECERPADGEELPAILGSPQYLLRGYDERERIVYGSGGVVPTGRIDARAEQLLADDRIKFVHVRSASNNCFQCRVEKV